MGNCCSKPFLQEPSPRTLPELYPSVGRRRTVFYTSHDCAGPGVKRTLPSIQICISPIMQQGEYGYKACRIMNAAPEYNTGYKIMCSIRYREDENFRKFPPYPRIVPRDFIQGIKQDVQDKRSKQETSPDPRAVIYSNYPIQEEPNRYDGPPNFIFFRRNIKDKPPSIGGYKERLMKAFKNILCCCIYRADVHYKRSKQETSPDPRAVIYSNYPIQEEPNRYDGPPNFIFFRRNIKAFENILCCCIYRADEIEDNSVYVLVKKDKKIKPFGERTYMDFPGGIEQDKFVFVPIKKNNQCNPIGSGANIDFPDFQYNKEEMGDEIKEGNSVYVLMKKNKKMNPFGAGTYMDVPDGIEQDEFVFVPIKKNNQCNPIGENIDFPEELLNFPIQETGLVSVPKINEIDA